MASLSAAKVLRRPVLDAVEALAQGRMILLFDEEGREEETDLIVPASHMTPAGVRHLRQDGGGLVFVAVGHEPATTWGLPFAHDVHATASKEFPVLAGVTPQSLPYDARSSFSIWVNHRDTYTGITDRDRSRTIRGLAELAQATPSIEELTAAPEQEPGTSVFARHFRAPGHVPLCVEHPQGLKARRGHTELATALSRMADLPPIMAGCEMLARDEDGALSRADAEKYARQHGLVFLTGPQLLEGYEQWKATHDTPGA